MDSTLDVISMLEFPGIKCRKHIGLMTFLVFVALNTSFVIMTGPGSVSSNSLKTFAGPDELSFTGMAIGRWSSRPSGLQPGSTQVKPHHPTRAIYSRNDGVTTIKQVKEKLRTLSASCSVHAFEKYSHGAGPIGSISKLMAKLKIYEGTEPLKQLQLLEPFKESQNPEELATFKLILEALFEIAVSDGHEHERREIFDLFLSVSGNMFAEEVSESDQVVKIENFDVMILAREACREIARIFPNILKYYKYHLQKEFDELLQKRRISAPLEVEFNQIFEQESVNFPLILDQELLKGAEEDCALHDIYFVRLIILFNLGEMYVKNMKYSCGLQIIFETLKNLSNRTLPLEKQ